MKYRKIFSIEVLNDYFPNGKGGVYGFVPTESCKQLLLQTGAFFKVWGNILYVIAKIHPDGRPVITVPPNSVFEFFIEPLDTAFFSYTLATIENSREVFWIKGQPYPEGIPGYLKPGPEVYKNISNYPAGAHVLSGEGNCFRALAALLPGSDLNDATKWTNLGKAASTRVSSRYYFHNASPEVEEGVKYLHPKPAVLSSAKTYAFGDMVSNPSGDVYEALKNLAPGSALNDQAAWVNRGKFIYSFGQSLMFMHGASPVLPVVPAAKHVVAEVFKVFPNGVLPAEKVLSESTFYEEDVSVHMTNCSGLSSGTYQIRINNMVHNAYIDAANSWQNFPAMVGIGNYDHLPANLALTDANGVLLSPEYSIRFAPRSVIWQLKYRGAQLPAGSDPNGVLQAVTFTRPGPQPNVFLSSLPVRLQKSAYKNGILLLNNNNDPPIQLKINHLPAPPTTGFEVLRQHDTDYFLSTTNLYS